MSPCVKTGVISVWEFVKVAERQSKVSSGGKETTKTKPVASKSTCSLHSSLQLSYGAVWKKVKTRNTQQLVTRTMCVSQFLPPPPPPPFPICALQALASVASHFPLPSLAVCFCFSSPGSLHRKLYTLEAFRKAELRCAFSTDFRHFFKKIKKRERWMKGLSNSQTPWPGQKQKSAVLLPSPHFPPLFHSVGVWKIPATRSRPKHTSC